MSSPVLKLAMVFLGLGAAVLLWEPARNLEYEYALVLSWAIIVACLVISFYFLQPQVKSWARLTSGRFVHLLLMPFVTLIPGAVLFTTRLCACSEAGFLFWLILLVVPACWLGVGIICATQRLKEEQPKWVWVIPAIISLVLISMLSAMWFLPQKRATNLLLGFLHGPIYDRFIPLDAAIIWARGTHAAIGIWLIVWGGRLFQRRSQHGLKIAGAVLLLSLAWSSIQPSQSHGLWSLDTSLPDVVRAKSIELHYKKTDLRSAELASMLAFDGEFHLKEITDALGAPLPSPIKVYAYSSETQKKLLFGGGETDITDVWTPSVHIRLEESPHPTLRHELVHAAASYVSWHGIGFHPNMVITEGLAMALAPTENSVGFDRTAASLFKTGRLDSIRGILDPLGFWSEAGSRSYVIAGSLLRWIIARYGPQAVRSIYSGQSIENVTGQTESILIETWMKDVLTQYNEEDDLLVESMTREPSVLNDQCPHSLADLGRPSNQGVLVQLRQPMGWTPDLLPEWRLNLDPGDREARLDLMRIEIGKAAKSGVTSQSNINQWITSLERSSHWPPLVVEDIEAKLIISDLQSLAGRSEESRSLLSRIYEVFKVKNPGNILRRQVEARLAIEQINDPAKIKAWRLYLAGWQEMPLLDTRAAWIERYLKSRRIEAPTRAQRQEWMGLLGDATSYPGLYREWLRLIAESFARARDYDSASELYARLEAVSTGEAKALAGEHIRRLVYLKEKFKR